MQSTRQQSPSIKPKTRSTKSELPRYCPTTTAPLLHHYCTTTAQRLHRCTTAAQRLHYSLWGFRFCRTTGYLAQRVANTQHAQSALYSSLEVVDKAVKQITDATEQVTTVFETEADYLDEMLFIKTKRSQRPQSERVRDAASLTIKNRELEIDPHAHDALLSKVHQAHY